MVICIARRRRLSTSGTIRITTCSAWYGSNACRAWCCSPARAPFGFSSRAAPLATAPEQRLLDVPLAY
jgi:hypothetical protein